MIEPEVPTAVVVDDRSAVDVGATVVAVPVWPGEGRRPWVGEGAADLHAGGRTLRSTAFGTRALLYWLETAQPADLATREVSRAAGASRRR